MGIWFLRAGGTLSGNVEVSNYGIEASLNGKIGLEADLFKKITANASLFLELSADSAFKCVAFRDGQRDAAVTLDKGFTVSTTTENLVLDNTIFFETDSNGEQWIGTSFSGLAADTALAGIKVLFKPSAEGEENPEMVMQSQNAYSYMKIKHLYEGVIPGLDEEDKNGIKQTLRNASQEFLNNNPQVSQEAVDNAIDNMVESLPTLCDQLRQQQHRLYSNMMTDVSIEEHFELQDVTQPEIQQRAIDAIKDMAAPVLPPPSY